MPSNDKPRARRKLLLNGRRVRIFDLVEADLLKPGEKLFFQERIGEAPYHAEVTERGRLRLPDGREFATPSAAAADVAGLRAGWSVWQVGSSGPSLHQLRLRLLKSVAEEVATGQEAPASEDEAARRLLDTLEAARSQAEVGTPVTMTVRELIRMWGFEDRDRTASVRIVSDLANHDLTTIPDFRAVSLDRTVRMIVPSEQEAETSAAKTSDSDSEKSVSDVNEESRDIGLTLGKVLVSGSLVSVSPSATFAQAITAMQINGYSQVAVLAGPHNLHGVVSWESIAAAKHRNPDASFSDAIDRRARDRVYDYDTRLVDVLSVLQAHEFVFVRDENRKITGIVTATDVVRKYDETVTPFFLIGELDQELRQLIQNTFTEETVRQACRSSSQGFSFDGMSIGDYQAVLGNPDCWAQLGWPLDRKQFVARLDELRKMRNDVMHFNSDLVESSEVEKLRNFLRLIRMYNV